MTARTEMMIFKASQIITAQNLNPVTAAAITAAVAQVVATLPATNAATQIDIHHVTRLLTRKFIKG
jgi:hypothetical protein